MSNNTFRPQPGVWYTLEFRATDVDESRANARLRVVDQSLENGALVEAAFLPSTNPPREAGQWSFEEVEPGWFIITARHSGKVLDVHNASVEDGAIIKQLTRHAPDSPNRFAQHFSVNRVDKKISPYIDRYVIRSRVSQKVLTIRNFSSSASAVKQYPYGADGCAVLTINPVGVNTFVPDPNLYYRIRNLQSGKVFDNSVGFHERIVLRAEKESPNILLSQQYRFEEVEPGWYILEVRHAGLVLSVTAASSDDGRDLQVFSRADATNQLAWKNQQWKIQRRGDGFLLINRNSGKAATSVSGDSANLIRQYPDSPDDDTRRQAWRFEVVEAQPMQPRTDVFYTLKFAHSNLAVAVEGGKIDENARVVQTSAAGQPYTQWRFEEVPGLKGFYNLVARHSGKVLSLPSLTLTEDTKLVQQTRLTPQARPTQQSNDPAMSQQWAVDTSPAGLVLCNRFSGRVLDVVDDSTTAGAAVQQTTRLRVGNLALTATADAAPAFKPRSDAWYVLRFAHSGKILAVSMGSTDSGAPVAQALDSGGQHQHWRLTEIEPGWYLLTARHSGKALELDGGSTSNGATIKQAERLDSNQNQHWALVRTLDGWALRARKSCKPIEVPSDAQDDGALVKQGSPQWDRNQSVSFEVYVSDATAATPVVRYTAPSLPASVVGVDRGTATGGTATAAPTTSSTVPDAVTASSPISTSILFAPYDLALSFTGDVVSQALSAGQHFVGPAQLPAPFNTAVDSLSLLLSTDPVGASLTFRLPSSCSLKSLVENEISGKISDSTLRGIVNNTLKPFAALMPTPTIILSTIEGEDETYGSYMAGFNAFASVPISDIPPFSVVHSLFPSAGLASRSLTLGIGTNFATTASARELWVSGNASLDLPLIPSFLTLKELSLALNKAATSVNTAGELLLSLKVPGEELSLRGGIDTTVEAGVSQSTVWAALDSEDGMWEDAFGIPGVDIAGMGIQVTPGGGVGVRGELHFGNGLLGARVGILVDPASPQSSILDIYSEEGLQLPRLLAPLLGSSVDLGTVCDVALTQLQLYVAPSGGSIAGQDYPQGTTLGGKLRLWGWEAAAQGTVTSNSLDIKAKADPLRLQVGGVSYLELTAASDPSQGPSFQFTLSNKKFGGSFNAAVSLLGGAIKGSLAALVNARGFSGTLMAGGGGIYATTKIALEQGLFRLGFSPTISPSVTIGGYRATLGVSVTVAVEVSATQFKQTVSFAFSAMGQTYKPGPFSVSVPFADADDLIEAFYEYAADLLTDGLTAALRQATSAAFSWAKATITSVIDDAAQLFRQVGADATKTANGLKNTYNASAKEVSHAMRSAYNWSVEQTGDYLRSAYDLSEGALAGALKDAGYATSEVQDLFESWGGSFADYVGNVLDPRDWF